MKMAFFLKGSLSKIMVSVLVLVLVLVIVIVIVNCREFYYAF